MGPPVVRVRLAVLHAAFAPERRESYARLRERLLEEAVGLEDRIDLHLYEEASPRGSLPAWLGIMADGVARAWAGRSDAERRSDSLDQAVKVCFAREDVTRGPTLERARALGAFAPTHLAFLPDDVTLGRGYVRGLLRAIEALPDAVLCGLSNHHEAARMRAAGVRWYLTRDAWNGFGAMPVSFAAEHLLWRRRALLPDCLHASEGGSPRPGRRVVQHDEGVSLHLMSLELPVLKTLPGLVQHDAVEETIDESFVAHDGAGDRVRRSSVSFEPETDLGEVPWENGPVVDAGRSYRGTHWSLVYDLAEVTPRTIELAYECERERGYFAPERYEGVSQKKEREPDAPRGTGIGQYLPASEFLSSEGRTADGGRPPHIWISVPEYQPALPPQRISLERNVASLRAAGVRVTVDLVVGQSLVTRARNWGCVHAMMRSRATHLFQWDGDVECLDPDAILSMLRTGHPVIGGAYPFRDGGSGKPCATLPQDPDRPDNPLARVYRVDDDQTIPAHEVATGFLLVERSVLSTLMSRNMHLLHEQDGGPSCGEPAWALFDTHLDAQGRGRRRRYLSEDWEFCRLCREVGITPRIYGPPTFRHWGLTPSDGHVAVAWGGKDRAEVYGGRS